MQFSDSTNKNGILQRIEYLTGLGDAAITGSSTLLKQMTAVVNDSFDEIMPYLLGFSDTVRFDDLNNTDLPIGTINLVSGQADYSASVDANSLAILNITAIRILTSSAGTTYTDLERIYLDDVRALDAMSPNSTDTGIPTKWLENNNVIYLSPKPNYSATSGIKLFFEREPSYFVSSDTSKTPGIPKIFHSLLPLIAAHEWLIVNKPSNTTVITRLEAKIAKRKQDLSDLISAKNPTRAGFSVSTSSLPDSRSGVIGVWGGDSSK